MIEHPKFVDIDEDIDFHELVEEVHESGDTIVLCRGNEEIAMLTPAEPKPGHREPSAEDLAAFRASAGSWADVDTDALQKVNRESRDISMGRPVSL